VSGRKSREFGSGEKRKSESESKELKRKYCCSKNRAGKVTTRDANNNTKGRTRGSWIDYLTLQNIPLRKQNRK
jgi:hypothetical protein